MPAGASRPAGRADRSRRATTSLVVTFIAARRQRLPITSYTATCASTDGRRHADSISGPHSPITVTGLTNGNTYTCNVTATNAVGTSTASDESAVVMADRDRRTRPPSRRSRPTANARISLSFVLPADNGDPIFKTRRRARRATAASPAPPSRSRTTSGETFSPIVVTGLHQRQVVHLQGHGDEHDRHRPGVAGLGRGHPAHAAQRTDRRHRRCPAGRPESLGPLIVVVPRRDRRTAARSRRSGRPAPTS